ncbi:MAG: hypothetical protein QW507_03120 [Candidatus Nanoarchaeia archaeon]|nr:hypothetical protein [Candidatus Haiyanarchaeum thermophilum]MCW1303222.1 hypothetical protein [Candidatus Haiyanarchaeum thermophilum]MCW1304047.1 hypothetical protein [Candidatus Haiyanarchaeum thermophilum]MCW1306786.1 hypothetical protein [Candidatus Haiyanarchaeum thermophilum]MCW1307469.1 hypothetical protein [Candidatus Haiyanarchaeum thermophilum]
MKCKICNKTFINREYLVKHLRHYHSKDLQRFRREVRNLKEEYNRTVSRIKADIEQLIERLRKEELKEIRELRRKFGIPEDYEEY